MRSSTFSLAILGLLLAARMNFVAGEVHERHMVSWSRVRRQEGEACRGRASLPTFSSAPAHRRFRSALFLRLFAVVQSISGTLSSWYRKLQVRARFLLSEKV